MRRPSKRKGITTMKCNEINIRDPYVVVKDGKYYMYGTRGKGYASKVDDEKSAFEQRNKYPTT